jgi:hypothetical protein
MSPVKVPLTVSQIRAREGRAMNSPYPPAVVAALTLLVVGVFTAKTLQDPAGSFLL